MSQSKKLSDDTTKDIRIVVSELSKTLDMAFDPFKTMYTDLMDYFKRRTELENEYHKGMSRLAERMTEKVDKVTNLLKAEGVPPDPVSGIFGILKFAEEDSKKCATRASSSLDFYTTCMMPAIARFGDMQTAKISKCKEILAAVGEELHKNVDDVFSQRNEYVRAFMSEQKLLKTYTGLKQKLSKQKKQSTSAEQKVEKAQIAYEGGVVETDKLRNEYYLGYCASRSCHERLFCQQSSDLVLVCLYKYSEFGNFLLEQWKLALQENQKALESSIKSLGLITFSDAYETDGMLSRHTMKFLDGSIRMSYILQAGDSESSIMATGPIKKQLSERSKKLQTEVIESLKELTEHMNETMCLKESVGDWKRFCATDIKEVKSVLMSKTVPTGDSVADLVMQYLDKAKVYVVKDTRLHHLKTIHSKLLQSLESPFFSQKSRIPIKPANMKKIMMFGGNLQEHCIENDVKIPVLITLCVQYLHENKLLNTKGIFRLSSSPQTLTQIKETISDTGKIEKESCPLAVANIMKQYLRELTGFIDSVDFSDKLANLSTLHGEEFITQTTQELLKIPKHSMDLIIFIAKFLQHVSSFSEENKMDLSNLSIIFGPTMFATTSTSERSVKIQTQINKFLKEFSSSVYSVYPEEAPLFSIEDGAVESIVRMTEEIDSSTLIRDEVPDAANAATYDVGKGVKTSNELEQESDKISATFPIPPDLEIDQEEEGTEEEESEEGGSENEEDGNINSSCESRFQAPTTTTPNKDE